VFNVLGILMTDIVINKKCSWYGSTK
jgi:hypothetical protein